ncbi:MAG: hypothetical protein HYV95_05930 [Opitutae bacterium]|nr:hypothetical protein [Opitutae bacterium]
MLHAVDLGEQAAGGADVEIMVRRAACVGLGDTDAVAAEQVELAGVDVERVDALGVIQVVAQAGGAGVHEAAAEVAGLRGDVELVVDGILDAQSDGKIPGGGAQVDRAVRLGRAKGAHGQRAGGASGGLVQLEIEGGIPGVLLGELVEALVVDHAAGVHGDDAGAALELQAEGGLARVIAPAGVLREDVRVVAESHVAENVHLVARAIDVEQGPRVVRADQHEGDAYGKKAEFGARSHDSD